MKYSKEVKTGILIIAAILIAFFGINFLKGNDFFSTTNTYYSVYENVDGLRKSNSIIINGVTVGKVDNVKLNPQNPKEILVKFSIENNLKINKNSVAQIEGDLLGTKFITIALGDSKEIAKNNDTLNGELEASLSESINKAVAPVKDKVETLISSVDTIITSLNYVLDDQTRNDLKKSFVSVKLALGNIESSTRMLAELVKNQSGNINNTLGNVELFTENLAGYNNKINSTLQNVSDISDSLKNIQLAKTVREVNKSMEALNKILANAEAGNGSLGKLLKDEKLYENLEKTSRHLDELIVDLNKNPQNYVKFSLIDFGGKKKDKKKDLNSNTVK